VSLSPRRLAATLAAVPAIALTAVVASAGSLPDSTWVALRPLPDQSRTAIFALAVNPSSSQVVLTGTAKGSIYRTADGGSTWTSVHSGTSALLTIAFSPSSPGVVLAGTSGGGALLSSDGGTRWSSVSGLEGRQVRAFGFAHTLVAAATDHGVYLSADGTAWTQGGLGGISIGAVAVTAVNPPVRLVAGGDSSASGGIPLFQSSDSGATWAPLLAAISGTVVAHLAAGPLPPNGNVRPLVVGTNTGLFESADNGATFTALSGGELLPSTDYTEAAFVYNHFDRFYASSDGGGSRSGGLWSTDDAGQHFVSLSPPLLSVTALAVSNDEQPILYVATFRPSDHVPALWAYHDTGGTPQGPGGTTTPSATAARHGSTGNGNSIGDLLRALFSSQVPYIVLGAVALGLITLAVVSNFRGRR
jgi:photosystem II stability/assembly factor-like uncharacterized protein